MPMPPRTKREHLRQLVADKNQWSRPLTAEERALGFLGWHERGYLPHCDFPNLVQFVTFRLGDSMPASRRGEWEYLLKIEDVRERRTKLEEYLDRGVGECHLRAEWIAGLMEAALRFEHGTAYELLAWCVMPNHVHVLVDVRMTPLWKLLKSWKQFVARQTNEAERRLPSRPVVEEACTEPVWKPAFRVAGVPSFAERRLPSRPVAEESRTEPVWKPALRLKWQREYWDTVMRDAEQQRKAIRYIEANPVKAKLCRTAADW